MAFPATPLNFWVELALGADRSASPATWVWTNARTYIYARDLLRFSRGRPDGAIQTQPSTCSFTGDNRDGRWCAQNPTGAWYGQIAVGTPVRVVVDEGVETVLWTGFIASLPPRWDTSEKDRYVPVTAAGILRELERGSNPLQSALVRTMSGTDPRPIAYWPCEDGAGASTLAEFFGGDPMRWVNTLTPASDGPDGSQPLAEFTSGAGLRGPVPGYSNTGQWHVMSVFNMPATPSGATVILRWTTTGTYPLWQVVLTPGSPDTISLEAYDTSNTRQVNKVANFLANSGDEAYGLWLLLSVSAVQDGADLDYTLAWYEPLTGTSTSDTATSVTTGTVTEVVVPATGKLDGTYMGHFAVWDTALTVFDDVDPNAIDGYTGESATARALRLGAEEGVTVLAAGGEDTMGPQPRNTFAALLRECEEVVNGYLVEDKDPATSLAYLTLLRHGTIENQTADLTLDHDSAHLAPNFEPEGDDQRLRNDWTVSRPDGSSARVVVDSGNLTPAKIGTRADSRTVNVDTDEALYHQAGWRLDLTTVEGLRHPVLKLNLARNPSLITSWLGCDIGSRVVVTNPPAGMPPDDIDVVMEWESQTLGRSTWDVTVTCAPYAPYHVFVMADTTADDDEWLGRLAGDPNAAIRAAIDGDDTSIAFDPNASRWTEVADDFDPDLNVRLGGEVVSVSSISTTAATYVAAGAAAHADNSAVTPAIFAGAQADDLILVLAAIRSSGTGTLTTPTGYTRLPVFRSGDNVQLYAKVHDGSESDPTVTPSGGSAGDTVSAFTFGFRGMPVSLEDLADAVLDSAAWLNASAANIAYPGVYPKLWAGCVMLVLCWKQDDYTSVAVPSGMTEILEASSTTGNDQSLYAAYQIQTTPTLLNEGSLAVTGGASAISRGATVALAGGYQTMTVSARSVNGVTKSHAVGTKVEVEDPGVLAL